MVEISGDVTDAGRTTNERTREDRATQPMDAGWLSFAIFTVVQSQRVSTVALNRHNMINCNSHKIYHIIGHTHVPRCCCFHVITQGKGCSKRISPLRWGLIPSKLCARLVKPRPGKNWRGSPRSRSLFPINFWWMRNTFWKAENLQPIPHVSWHSARRVVVVRLL